MSQTTYPISDDIITAIGEGGFVSEFDPGRRTSLDVRLVVVGQRIERRSVVLA
jgi:hypothetical protein